MFNKHNPSEIFVDVLERLVEASKGQKPATLHNGAKRILERSKDFEGVTVDELISFILSPPKKAKTTRKAKNGKAPHSKALVSEKLSEIEKFVDQPVLFSRAIQQMKSDCRADTVKAVAAAFAASTKPTTVDNAIELLEKERANRKRSFLKRKESAAATPW
ncbi:MAG: hypothetical protein AAGF33_13790 [Pseudomonadota bacterium]